MVVNRQAVNLLPLAERVLRISYENGSYCQNYLVVNKVFGLAVVTFRQGGSFSLGSPYLYHQILGATQPPSLLVFPPPGCHKNPVYVSHLMSISILLL